MTTHKLVPVEPTIEMEHAALDDGGYDRPLRSAFPDILAAAPNQGRVSRAQLQKAERAVRTYWVSPAGFGWKVWSAKGPVFSHTTGVKAEDECARLNARAVIAALGLEIEGD